MRFRAVLTYALLASAVGAQIPLPPHSSVYNGFSRGFSFTAATNFFIVQLDLPPNAFQAGDTASYLVRINGAVALRSVGNAGAIPTAIPVVIGDAVDVIGNWSPAAAASFTAHNSYGSTAPYASVIEGVPHTLSRSGWQWDIGDPAWTATGTTGVFLPPTSGSIGRVLVTTAPAGGTLATNTTLGAGCGVPPLTLTPTTRPILGTSWDFTVSNIPATAVLGVDVYGLTDPNVPDLTFLGLPGCGLRSSLDFLLAWPVTGTTYNRGLALPNNPALVGQHLFTTSAVFLNPPPNPFGAYTANGVDGAIGDV